MKMFKRKWDAKSDRHRVNIKLGIAKKMKNSKLNICKGVKNSAEVWRIYIPYNEHGKVLFEVEHI